jgi:WXXGXW repeat (2 copies)
MRKVIAANMICGVCSCVLFWLGSTAAGQPVEPEQQEGVEVLTRGPMHEAYAAPESLDPKPSPIVPKQPPDPVPEMPPDQKPDGSHVVWISGYWAWDDEQADFLWVSGFWRDLPPGKRWVPGHWAALGGGWQWSPGFWADEQQTTVEYVPPPPPTLETGPAVAAPEADQFYSPGCWVYIERQFRWRPGFWLKYRPGWIYTPAQYVWTPAGCILVDGYWDYELTRRGLLFCPVRFTANVWTRPGWRLHNSFIVYPDVIVSALFARPDYHRFYFGDYFGDSFVRHGFIPWVDYRLRANIPAPLFHQYAWSKRAEPNWDRDLRKSYDDRRTGIAPPPPRTIAQQQQFMRDLAEHKEIKVGTKTFAVKNAKIAERNLMMANPVAKVDRNVVPLKAVTPEAHAQVLKTIEHHAQVNQERKQTAIKILKETPPIRPSDAHVEAKLPALPQHLITPKAVAIPQAPAVPAHVEKVIPKYTPPAPPKASSTPTHHGRLSWPVDVWVAQVGHTGVGDNAWRLMN